MAQDGSAEGTRRIRQKSKQRLFNFFVDSKVLEIDESCGGTVCWIAVVVLLFLCCQVCFRCWMVVAVRRSGS
jgi:hypothetical protein